MTDYTQPERFDPSDFDQVQRRRDTLTISERGTVRQIPRYAPGDTPRPIVRRVEAPAPMQIDAPLPVQTVQRLATSHVDRAKGFTIKALPLSVAVGVGGLLIAVGIGWVPLASMGALLVLFLAFLVTWLAAFVWSESASPDGVTLWQVLLHYRLLSREQKARLQRMELDE